MRRPGCICRRRLQHCAIKKAPNNAQLRSNRRNQNPRELSRRVKSLGILIGLLSCFIAMSSARAQISFTIDRFIIEGENPISQRIAEQTLAPFTGEQSGIERLREAAAALENEINRQGFDFHRVTLPPQTLEAGAVKLEIRSLVIGEVSTSGNKNFSDENLRRSLPQLRTGATPNTRALSRTLAVVNFNTAKRTRLTFGRGSEDNSLDARIEVRDRKPQQVYTWLNNTGSEQSGRSRIGVGYQHRNLFDRDHNLTATYTTSPEQTEDVRQYGLNYQIPLYAIAGTLGLFHIDSDIDNGRVADFFDVSGGGEVSGLRYSQVLNKIGDYRQRAYIDVSDKLFDNDVEFAGTEIGVDVGSRPLAVSWQVEWDKLVSSGRFNISWAVNLDGGRFNTQEDYSASRVGAPQDWQAVRLNYNHRFNLPNDWQLDFTAIGQYSDDPLISGEQLGLGGAYGPRGFEEREAGVDRGLNLKLELWAPALENDMQFGGFIDHGSGDRLNPQIGEQADRDLLSVGLSAKWQWNNRLVARIDAGHVIEGFGEQPTLTQDGDNRLHLNLVYKIYGE